MIKKNEKKKEQIYKTKEYIPENLISKIREPLKLKISENIQSDYFCLDVPCTLYSTFKDLNDENLLDNCLITPNLDISIINTINCQYVKTFMFSDTNIFNDLSNLNILFPSTFVTPDKKINWLRPKEYIRENMLELEIIRNNPGKNYEKIKENIKEKYNLYIKSNENEEDKESELLSFQRYFRFYNYWPLIYIVKTEEANYNSLEYTYYNYYNFKKNTNLLNEINSPNKKLSNKNKYLKDKKKDNVTDDVEFKLEKCVIPKPSLIQTKNFKNPFSKWISSLFNIIIEYKLNDVNVIILIILIII